MIIQDPAGLLQRIPELRELCEDAAVRRAVEGGDPFKVYRALMWARALGRLRSHRELVTALLRQRRLFARPIKGAPWLGTVNGFGAGFVGASDQDPNDGTHIATHALVALFAIPLLPLGAYVVRAAEGGNALSGRSWSIFARVPLGMFSWLYSRAVALGVVALVASGAVRAFVDSRSQDVHVVNAFDTPLLVTLGGKTESVPPRSVHVLAKVPVGRQHGTATTQAGVEVDAVDVDVDSSMDVVGWNIAGGYPVMRDIVEYSKDSVPAQESSTHPTEHYCGQRVFIVQDADDIFRKPPNTVSMSSSQRMVRRVWVDLMPDVEKPRETCEYLLAGKNRLGDALAFVEAEARLSDWAEEQAVYAASIARFGKPEEAVRVTRAALAHHPDSVELHATYQWAMESAGQRDALLADYRQRAEAAPDSPVAQYLYTRLLEGPEASAARTKLADRFPEDRHVLRAFVYDRWQQGDWEGTARAWERLRNVDPGSAFDMMDSEVSALVALGHKREAATLLKGLFTDDQASRERRHIAELYARVTRLEKDATPDVLISELEQEPDAQGKLWLIRARAGLLSADAPASHAVQLLRVIGKDPAEALRAASLVTQFEATTLPHGALALVYGEAVRTGTASIEQVLATVPFLGPHDQETFKRFVRGEDVPVEALEMDPEMRAAACLVRARGAVSPEERQRLLERAKREDVLAGPVSEAVASWSL